MLIILIYANNFTNLKKQKTIVFVCNNKNNLKYPCEYNSIDMNITICKVTSWFLKSKSGPKILK
jgi:dTDP-4-dehydrorhamnose 3,5-epimerase-like enzyme